MIGELRLKDFLALTLEDIDVPLHEAVGVKAEVTVVKLAVGVDVFGELQVYLLTALALDTQSLYARRVDAEIIEPALFFLAAKRL